LIALATLQRYMYFFTRLALPGAPLVILYHNKDKVYELSITMTDQVVKSRRGGRKPLKKVQMGVRVEVSDCKACESVTVGGICINKNCDTNLQPEPES
jgi:hypothetical protein